jgi:hypothetical protein
MHKKIKNATDLRTLYHCFLNLLFQNAKRTLLFFSYTLLTLDSIKPIAQVMKKTNTSKKGSGSIDWLFWEEIRYYLQLWHTHLLGSVRTKHVLLWKSPAKCKSDVITRPKNLWSEKFSDVRANSWAHLVG